jgi:hypothetical protein
MLCNEDVEALEDAWTDACENYGADSPEAKAAWEAYEEARNAKRQQDEEFDVVLAEEGLL